MLLSRWRGMPRLVRWLGEWTWLLCAMVASCRTPSLRDQAAPVQIRAVSASYPGETHADFTVRFAFRSPKGRPGTASRLDWELWLQGRWFASGRQELTQSLAAADINEFDVTLPLAFRRPAESEEAAELPAGIRGLLYVRWDHSEDPLPFEQILRVRAKPVFAPAGVE
jgi:hypothetical protein